FRSERPHVLARALRLRVGKREALRYRARALEVRLLRVRERQAGGVGAVAYAQLLVAPVRPLARRGDGLGGEAPVWPRRRQARGAAQGGRAASEARPQGAARRLQALDRSLGIHAIRR